MIIGIIYCSLTPAFQPVSRKALDTALTALAVYQCFNRISGSDKLRKGETVKTVFISVDELLSTVLKHGVNGTVHRLMVYEIFSPAHRTGLYYSTPSGSIFVLFFSY